MDKHSQPKPILETKNVSKDYSGVYALKDVNLQIYPGQVTAIIGENGAGKSTLMNIVSGIQTQYEGKVFLYGKETSFLNPKEAAERGVVMIHQELNLVPYLSITENLFLGQELTNRFGLLDYPEMHRKSRELLQRLQLDINPSVLVNQLRVGQQQLVEIARALLFDSKVLIMDEPTSAISDHEVTILFRIIRELKSPYVAIVYISHKLKEIFEIADRYEVLRDGEHVGSGIMIETTHEKLVRLMVGRKMEERAGAGKEIFGEEVMRLENISFRNPENKTDFFVRNVSFSLHKGEIIGIAGLMGAGRSELLEAIFGLHPKHTSGRIIMGDEEIRFRNPNDAIAAGIGLVPEDRKIQGLILMMNVTQNTSLASLKKLSSFGFIRKKKEEKLGKSYVNKLNTSVPSTRIEAAKLSGGNQQKVILAKWLATNPRILLLDEPTRGIDVGAKAEIYNLIKELAEQGMGIIVVSSEIPEILAISDTVVVLSESKLTAVMKRDEANEEKIMNAAIAEKN